MKLKQIIVNAVNEAVKLHRYNQSKAAKYLGISRGMLRKYMSNDLKRANLKKSNRTVSVEL